MSHQLVPKEEEQFVLDEEEETKDEEDREQLLQDLESQTEIDKVVKETLKSNGSIGKKVKRVPYQSSSGGIKRQRFGPGLAFLALLALFGGGYLLAWVSTLAVQVGN